MVLMFTKLQLLESKRLAIYTRATDSSSCDDMSGQQNFFFDMLRLLYDSQLQMSSSSLQYTPRHLSCIKIYFWPFFLWPSFEKTLAPSGLHIH